MGKRFKDKKHRLSENDLENISGGRERASTSIIGLAAAFITSYITAKFVGDGVRKGLDRLLDKLEG